MLQTVEAVINKGSQIQFLEPLTFPQTRQRVLVILLNDESESLVTKVLQEKKPKLNAKSAVARLRKLSKGIRWKSLDGMSIREAREEGRKY
ncbi:hypothetical protein QUF54_03335 [Candidatus Marithioploca araucensis]|uniref:Uncharacterized protein n=1 Tax=Candidatus Marithioploca araucensis TaxID=70273 RepID=A0ABT7VRT4_9GAMM|nr:hypothetical protein [Candidatus Marithioploca araucensis]